MQANAFGEKKYSVNCIGKVTLFYSYFHNSALMLPIMLPGLCGTKGSLHPRK